MNFPLEAVENKFTVLCGLLLVAVVSASPIMMTAVMDRGHEIPKLMLAAPLAMFALAAAIAGLHWRDTVQEHAPTRVAAFGLGLFICLAGVTTATSALPESAFLGSFFRLEGLAAWTTYGAVFLATLAWARSTGRIQSLVDAMIFASLIPAIYALQQSMNLDFFVVAGRDPSRANGTQGNPIQLAEYLAQLIPLTIARIVQIRPWRIGALPWILVLILQIAGLWVTQTRGPLLASLAGLVLFAMLYASLTRKRAWFIVAAAVTVSCIVFVAVINSQPQARAWAQSEPFLGRMVFDVGRDAGASTSAASRSILARLGIWQAGVDTFAASSTVRQLFGHGPESAYPGYYAHIPIVVINSDDFRAIGIFDKLHADVLDIVLNFGLVGWVAYFVFFCAVFLGSAQALFRRSAPVSLFLFVFTTAGCGAAAAVFAAILGFSNGVAPAACLGFGVGWMLFMGLNAWRMAGKASAEHALVESGSDRILLAGLTTSLLAFWMDAQISIPLLTPRIISFAIAALILAAAGCRDDHKDGDKRQVRRNPVSLVDVGFAFALTAACSSFLPVVVTDATIGAIPELGLRLIPVASLSLVAALVLLLNRQEPPVGAWWKRGMVIFGPPLVYVAIHLAMRVSIDRSYGPDAAMTVACLVALGPAFIAILSVFGVFLLGSTSRTSASKLAVTQIVLMAGFGVLGGLTAFWAWKAQFADILVTSSRWSVVHDRVTGDKLIAAALSMQPREWQYKRIAIQRQLAGALALLGPDGLRSESQIEFWRTVQAAEAGARDAVRLEPVNPWAVILLANVMQLRALRLIRAYDTDSGERAELEADELYAKAQRIFPAQPVIYRNWAHLKFDNGLPTEGFRLLDVMESIIPDEPEPYIERILMAQRYGDFEAQRITLERAGRQLSPAAFSRVEDVVRAQR